MSKDKIANYEGNDVNVRWNGRLCIHIGECGRAKGDLFVGGRDPWCQPNQASGDEVEEVVLRCPTGALTWDHKDGVKPELAEAVNTIHVVYNGPLYVKGDLDIEDAPDDAPGLQFRAALCRCGASKNKPFCDNSHEEAGFRDYGAVGETGTVLEEEGGTLNIKPIPNGPLVIKGNLSISSGNRPKAWQGRQVALCRCGASKNKPFCDGAHSQVDFNS
jgi:CDGSH-type Zn-finger protein/uncharacterized Fe-S cluster protein YjdI